jgi:hypothetical protein
MCTSTLNSLYMRSCYSTILTLNAETCEFLRDVVVGVRIDSAVGAWVNVLPSFRLNQLLQYFYRQAKKVSVVGL